MIRGIIFDCFGVLYVDVSRVYFANFPEHHDELYDLNKISDHGFIGKEEYIAKVAGITGLSVAQTAEAFKEEYVANKDLIEWLRTNVRSRVSVKIGLLSNIGRGWIQDFFDEHQLHDLFDATILSGEEGITKPNPIIFERTAERLGLLPEECLMVDDKQENVDGALAAGMKSLLYVSNEQLKKAINSIIMAERERE